jgi:predicted MFS family arabinose efflux permease
MRFGLVAAAMTVSAAAGGLASQRPAAVFGVRRVAAVGTILLAGACALLAGVSHGGSAVLVLTALPIFGAGMGAAAVCGQIAALTGVAGRDSGLAAGLADTSFAVGTALGARCAAASPSRPEPPSPWPGCSPASAWPPP